MYGLIGSVAAAVAVVVVILVILAAALVGRSLFTVVTEYERAVFFRLGRIRESAKGPGPIIRIPGLDRVVKVSLRVEAVDIPSQQVITADNVTVAVDAVVYFQVIDPVAAVVGVDRYRFASERVAMTSLRSIIGRFQLDDLLAHRGEVNTELRAVIAASTTSWGVEVRQVEVRDISLPQELLRAMARQAEGRTGTTYQSVAEGPITVPIAKADFDEIITPVTLEVSAPTAWRCKGDLITDLEVGAV